MNNICSENECKREVFENGKCIFHCKKDDWNYEKNEIEEWNKIKEKIKKFWDEIRLHVKESVPEVNFPGINFKKFIFPKILSKEYFPDYCYYSFYKDCEKQKKKKLIFRNCIFLGSICIPVFKNAFYNCEFQELNLFINDNSKSLELINCKKFFGKCTISNFEKHPLADPNSQEPLLDIKIRSCKFNIDIDIKQLWISKLSIYNTSFKQTLKLNDCLIEEIDILNTECSNIISIQESDISKKFILSNDESDKDKKKINKFVFENNKFCKKSDISFENVKINYLSFNKVENYSEGISFFDTKILKELEFNNINLSNAEFHNCNFEKIKEKKIQIQNVSFISNNGFTIFNGVKWGDISKTFDPSTDRDTFRQLKYTNEKQGNIIEANKFYSAEMDKYQEELFKSKCYQKLQDKFIFCANKFFSNFSQNWILPLVWYLILGFIFSFIYYTDYSLINNYSIASGSFLLWSILLFFIEIIKYKNIKISIFVLPIASCINYFNNVKEATLNQLINFINPFNTTGLGDNDSRLIWWILFRIFSVFIIYQFIISLRRQTRR